MEADMAKEMEVAEPENAQQEDLEQVTEKEVESGVQEEVQQEDLDQATKEELGVTEEEAAQKIDLNTATLDELKTIPGIKRAVAKRIIDYRKRTGGFLSKDEILGVSGIGPALYVRIADRVMVVPLEGQLEEEAVPPEVSKAPEPEPSGATHAEAVSASERDRGRGWAWLWSALLGALLGVICTLLILFAINGSLTVSQTPVVVDMSNRLEGLSMDVGELQDEIHDAQQRLQSLEGLPARVEAAEETVGEMREMVQNLEQRADALDGRVDTVQEDLAQVQKQADRAESFFQQLQSLLVDLFGATPSSSQ